MPLKCQDKTTHCAAKKIKALVHGIKHTVPWNHIHITKFIKMCMIESAGEQYCIQYCWAILREGSMAEVSLPFKTLNKTSWRTELIQYANKDGINAVTCGLLNCITIIN